MKEEFVFSCMRLKDWDKKVDNYLNKKNKNLEVILYEHLIHLNIYFIYILIEWQALYKFLN